MFHIIYLIMLVFEGITCFIFFENSYNRKQEPDYWDYRVHITYPAVIAVNFAVSFIELPILNLITFFCGTVFIAWFCYMMKLKTAVFLSGILTAFMLVAELGVAYFSSLILQINVSDYRDDPLIYFGIGGLNKLVFFLLAFVVAKVFLNKERSQETNRFLIALGVLPLATVVILHFLFYSEINHRFDETYSRWMTLCSMMLLLANIVVFAVYDFVQRSNNENLFLQIDNIKNKARIDYYEMLMNQYENRSILIHDIKRHLVSIEAAAQNGDSEGVTRYIDTIRADFGLDDRIRFSGNRILGVIINRYDIKCKDLGISFTAEAKSVPDDFINEVDLTALIDNLLENAAESALKSEIHHVSFNAVRINDHFLIVNIKNSCDIPPKFDKDGTPKTKKIGKNHGWGTKSIGKVLKKYDGELKYKYHEEEKQFETELMIKV